MRPSMVGSFNTPSSDPTADAAGAAGWSLGAALEVVHAYFAEPSRCRLRFAPSPEAHDWLSRSAAVLRAGPNGISLYAARPLGAAVLDFGVYPQDPHFAQCTAGLAGGDQPPARVDTAAARFDVASGTWVLGVPEAQPGVVHPQRRPVAPPAFVVTLRLSGAPSERGRRYRVLLTARSTVWKYILLGGWAAERPYIVDVDRGVEFEPAEAERVAADASALAIRSKVPLALQERPTRRFQLRGRSDHPEQGDRPLIQRLPAANAAQLGFDTRGDTPAIVSEIYVQR